MTFEPFQKVLVRSDDILQWSAALYSHKCGKMHVCNGITWAYCIPYEGNEHLLGTSGSTGQVEFEFGEHVEVSENMYNWCKAVYIDKAADAIIKNTTMYRVLDVNGVVSLWEYCRKADW